MADDLLKLIRNSANPYDFANPVSDEKRFFGRTAEAGDVVYYLNHAKQTSRPIHLAFVGARASGKTSFLNMTELEAKRRDFCTVRVNLNEGDVLNDLHFFRKLLNAVVTSAFSAGAFGGKAGAKHLSYVELMATGQAPDKEHIPFISAFFIARGLNAGSGSATVPDEMLAEDLALISEEIKRPVVILIDECNVLVKNRIILEKLRNIFMNLSGYMLVFAATDDFFPVMDEVFSPIMRQFKRIDIGPFKDEDDVSGCIKQPLHQIGLTDRQIAALVSPNFIREVDLLTGRRPYEIQLICHMLFRSCQERDSKRFSLDLSTLENIQAQLASGQNLNEKSAIRAAQSLNRKMFNALDAVSSSSESLSAEDWWRLEYLFYGNTRWTKETFISAVNHLIDNGSMVEKGDVIKFSGDDFDRIYIKYYARSKQAQVRFWLVPLETLIFSTFIQVYGEFESMVPLGALSATDYFDDAQDMINFVEGHIIDETPGASTPLIEQLFAAVIRFPEGKKLRLFEVYYITEMGSGQYWFIWPSPEHVAGIRKLTKRLSDLTARGLEVGFSVQTKWWDITVPSVVEVVSRVRRINDDQLNTRMANIMMEMVKTFYVNRKDKESARRMAEGAFVLAESRLHSEANNVGYLHMDAGNYEEAALWFKSAKQYDADTLQNLLQYNIGILSALVGNFDDAAAELNLVTDEQVEDVACVYRINGVDGRIVSEEVERPESLVELAQQALSAIEAVA